MLGYNEMRWWTKGNPDEVTVGFVVLSFLLTCGGGSWRQR